MLLISVINYSSDIFTRINIAFCLDECKKTNLSYTRYLLSIYYSPIFLLPLFFPFHRYIHHFGLARIIVPLRRPRGMSVCFCRDRCIVDRPGESPKVYDRLRRNPLQVHVCITASVPVHPRRRSRADAFRESFRSSFHSGKAVYRSAR